MRILCFGYSGTAHDAPHQAMAAIHLARQGHAVDFICWGSPPTLDDARGNLRCMPQPKAGIGSAVRLLLLLVRRLAFGRAYEVVYVQGAQQTPFLFWLPFAKRGRRIVYHTQDFLEPRRHRFYERFERWFARHADHVVCNEVNRGRFMHSHYGLRHRPAIVRTLLPAWWDVPARNERLRLEIVEKAGRKDDGNPRLVAAGGMYRDDRMSPQVLDALATLPDNYILVFNGDAMLEGRPLRRECERRMRELGVERRVVFLGGLSYAGLLELFGACDIGLLLYPNDGIGHFYQCPGRLSEYLRCGLSLVASNYPSLELPISTYSLGAVCDPEDPSSIADAIRRAGETCVVRRAGILETANRVFVYEHDAHLLDKMVAGEYKHAEPSVST